MYPQWTKFRRPFLLLMLAVMTAPFSSLAASRSNGSARQAIAAKPQGLRYEDYPAGKALAGKPAPVKLTTPKARKYRTELREGAAKGPNFAGHYAVVSWGCGSSCVQFAIVDSATGDVFFPSFYVAVGVSSDEDADHTPEPVQYKLESKLLVVTGNLNEAENGGIYYYKWDNNRLTLVKQSPLPKQ
ncbi:MAG TPA: hypothetical protein VEZ90_16745 [Blastocatellia bacterium]|nr:hypothetical protein [Blastocatellia bacterium]